MPQDVIDLKDDEYEVVESRRLGRITSDTVKRKLESENDPDILQEDFDSKGITDYLSVGEHQYPRNVSDYKPELAGAATAGALHATATYLSGDETMLLATIGVPVAMYLQGLMYQDIDFNRAMEKSYEEFF